MKPTDGEVSGLYFPDGFLEIMLPRFDIKPKFAKVYNDPLLSVIKNNDVSTLNINDITFDFQLEEDSMYLFFGWDVTTDRLAIDKSNKKIVLYDVYSDGITFQCAESSEKFLDALVEIMKFSKEKMLNDYDEETRDKRSKEVAYIVSLKAGGEEYEDYYKSVLWVE